MEDAFDPFTKEYLTTIVKKAGLLFFSVFILNCNSMKENKFIISGNEDLLANSKICIVKNSETGTKEVKSLLYLNKHHLVSVNNDIAEYYNIYVSFNDSIVTVLKFENINRNISKDDINLEMEKDDDGNVGIKNSYAKSLTPLIPFEEYYRLKND